MNAAKAYEPAAGFGLYPAYVRGQAYLQGRLPQQAAAEFQKIFDHPGVVQNSVIGALAHLQLGRAQVMMGDQVPIAEDAIGIESLAFLQLRNRRVVLPSCDEVRT